MSIIPNICSAISSVTLTRTRFNKAINQTLTRRGRPFGAQPGWLRRGAQAAHGVPRAPRGGSIPGGCARPPPPSALRGARPRPGIGEGDPRGPRQSPCTSGAPCRVPPPPGHGPRVPGAGALRGAAGIPAGGEGVNGSGPTQQKENFIMK